MFNKSDIPFELVPKAKQMHILIIDGFGESAESRARFKNFSTAVNAAFDAAWPFDRHVEARRYDELWDYLDLSSSSSAHMIRVEPIKVI